MRRMYRFILALYPAEYRANFAPEMRYVFDEAAEQIRLQGRVAMSRFAAREIVGLFAGLMREWVAKSGAPGSYIAARHTPPVDPNVPAEIHETRQHVQQLIRRMEFAIAHHDFPNARRYSYEERAVREHLDRLMDDNRRREARARRAG